MPNWCSNEMAVYGPRDELVKFAELIKKARETARETKHWELYDVFALAGFDDEGMDKLGWSRGYFDGDVPEIESKDGTDFIQVSFETAWSPMCEAWDALLRRRFPNLKQVTCAVESGCDVYVNTDVDGLFFPWTICVDAGYENSVFGDFYPDSYNTREDALHRVNEWLGESFDSLEEAEEYVLADKYGNGDNWFNVHEFHSY